MFPCTRSNPGSNPVRRSQSEVSPAGGPCSLSGAVVLDGFPLSLNVKLNGLVGGKLGYWNPDVCVTLDLTYPLIVVAKLMSVMKQSGVEVKWLSLVTSPLISHT